MRDLETESEAHFDFDLKLVDFAFLDESTCLNHFKPVQVFECLTGPTNSVLNTVFNGCFGYAHKFDQFVCFVLHNSVSSSLGLIVVR